jgi:hypothetical protein
MRTILIIFLFPAFFQSSYGQKKILKVPEALKYYDFPDLIRFMCGTEIVVD